MCFSSQASPASALQGAPGAPPQRWPPAGVLWYRQRQEGGEGTADRDTVASKLLDRELRV